MTGSRHGVQPGSAPLPWRATGRGHGARVGLLGGLLLLLAWGLLNGLWIRQDRLIRDGDEEGQVGAAELVATQWAGGQPGAAVATALGGDLGEYPPLYAGVVGLWWAWLDMGDPGRLAVRGLNLLWPVVAAVAVAWLVSPLGVGASWSAMLVVLLLPLLSGLGRHFMLEGPLTAAVCVAVVATEGARRRPGPATALLLGLVLGAAFLVKQTSVLYLFFVVVFLMPRCWWSLLSLLVAALVAGQWFIPLLGEQVSYGGGSARGPVGVGLLTHLIFYPRSLFWVGAGPALTATALLGLMAALAPVPHAPRAAEADLERRRLRTVALVWFLGSLLALTLLPRKYPRLLAPALPSLALLVALAWSRGRSWRWPVAAGLLGASLWWGLGSWRGVWWPPSAETLDARCAQRWFRPAVGDDLGLGAVVTAAAACPYGPVLVLDPPPIPCQLQTTFDWDYHLGPALRRAGLDRPVVRQADGEPPTLVVDWGSAKSTRGRVIRTVDVPALGRFRILVP